MVEAERELLRGLLGDVRFNDLELLFRNGANRQGSGYAVNFSFRGIDGAHLGEFPNERGTLRHGHFQKWFVQGFPEGYVSGTLGPSSEPVRYQVESEHLSWVANRYLENEEIRNFLRGIKSHHLGYMSAKGLIHIVNWTPAFLSGLAFGDLTPEQLMEIRREGLAEMRKPSPQHNGFDNYARNLLVRRLSEGDRRILDSGSYREPIGVFADQFFAALCADEEEHDESNFLTEPAKAIRAV